jgi:hypothetical protein
MGFAMAGVGGRRPGAGRKPGIPNRSTAEIKGMAQPYGPAAIARLAQLAGLIEGVAGSESEPTQLGAMKELLDRGYGRAAQTIAGDRDSPLFPKITVLFGDQDDTADQG